MVRPRGKETANPCPITDCEVAFVYQFIFEQLQLAPGPAHGWLRNSEINALDLRWFGVAMSKSSLDTEIGPLLTKSTQWERTTPFRVPWTDRADFMIRLHIIRQWIETQASGT